MSNYFIGSTATVEMFSGSTLFATARTMINNSISIDVSEEEVRGGEGAALRGTYNHSSSFGLKFEDSMFKLDYIAKNIGSSITLGGDVLYPEEITLTSGGAGTVLVNTPVAFGDEGIIGWANIKGESTVQTVTFTGSAFTFSGGTAGDIVCVKYLYLNSAARKLVVSANIIPDTIRVILKAGLFAGQEGSETKVGTIRIDVPRFKLMGTSEISLAMDGVSGTSLEGKALAVEELSCDESSYYATILEVLTDAVWSDSVIGLAIISGDFALTHPATETLDVRYVTSDGYTGKVSDYSDLTFVSSETGYATISASGIATTVAAGDTLLSVTITAKPTVDASVTLTVS